MPLTSFTLDLNVGWQLQEAIANYQPLVQGPDGTQFSLDSVDLTTFTQLATATNTLAASATTTFDFFSFTNLVTEATGFTKILALLIVASGDATAIAKLEPGASNPLTWFFGGTTPSISIPSGGIMLFSLGVSGTPQVVDSTHRNMKLTNSGTGNLTVALIALGGP